jgi:hypothetical protein
MAPHSEGCEFPPEIDKYRGIVEDAVFDRLGRLSFFDGAVEVVMGRIAARLEQQHLGTATSEKQFEAQYIGKLENHVAKSKDDSWQPAWRISSHPGFAYGRFFFLNSANGSETIWVVRDNYESQIIASCYSAFGGLCRDHFCPSTEV